MSPQVWNQMILIFGYVAVGYGCNKFGIFDEMTNSKLSSFLLKVTIPCTIFVSAFNQTGLELSLVLYATAITAVIFILLPLFSKVVARLFHWENTFELMMTYSNLGFMGLPIIRSVYGEEAVFYVVIFMMIFNIHIFTMGIVTLHGKMESPKAMLKKMTNPGVVSALIAFVIVFAKLSAPSQVVGIMDGVGSITTPLAMMVIGSQVAQVNLRKVITRWDLYLMSAFKLVIFPAVIHMLLLLTVGEGLFTNVATILVGMPIAGNVTMLCSEYGGDTSLSAQGTCICTMLSMATLTMMLNLLG